MIVYVSSRMQKLCMQRPHATRSRKIISRHIELYIRVVFVYMTVLYFCALHVKYERAKTMRALGVHRNQSKGVVRPLAP